ncbi:MAG: 30S ribosomal protein S4 [Candidatus Pacebacteria bacterium]|nr:30S ribosomal protein S4 [Candidatus Paceibacterota bacterium]MCF7857070.1 30S ribosomal protein S4 [Candidatus Paceibacterota bacterium]
MIIGPKYKIAKRLGAQVFEKTQTEKFALSEARSARTKTRRGRGGMMSDYKKQLIEKQRMRFSYGISEKQLSKYVEEAFEKGHQPIADLIARLESRLDNVVYRLGFAKTRRLARQIVSHGHIFVNGKRLNIASHAVKVGDKISIRENSKPSALFVTLSETLSDHTSVNWLELNQKDLIGEKKSEPTYEPSETFFDPQQVLEYYSR